MPGPSPDHFLLGNFWEMIKPTGGMEWAKKYGNVYRCYGLFNEPRVYILDEKNVQKVLVNDAYTKFSKTIPNLGYLKRILGEGFDSEINSLTGTSRLADSLSALFDNKHGSVFHSLSFIFPILRSLPLKINQEIEDATIEIEKITRKLVQDKFDKFKEGKLDSNDLVSVLVKASYGQEIDQSERMSFEEIRNQIMTFLIAGHETTGVMMTWALYYLSKDQEIQDKLREEIVKEFPDKDSELNFDQINSMEYLNAVCKETLRIAPPVLFLIRAADEDVMIDEYLIPKGTPIFIPTYQIHHLASIWGDDVEKFNPSRWFTEKVKGLSHYNYLPFSAGPKSCIASKLALNEAKIILCNLLRNFRFHEVEGFKVASKMTITFRPDPTVKLWVSEVDY
ncbi:7199_t:CDS:2 [Entrophospora sp. SA101]|nr:7199_t:CDS:2 [Entrophospora sp. SA101]